MKYLKAMAAKQSSSRVLGASKGKAGGKTLRSVEDVLTSDQRRELQADLSKIARTRQEAEASSQSLRFK